MATATTRTNDVSLRGVPFVPARWAAKLEALEIRTIRQLAGRLESEAPALGDYLDLDEAGLRSLCTATEKYVQEHFPAAALRSIHPRVHRRGVAVHRLGDRSRPRFRGD